MRKLVFLNDAHYHVSTNASYYEAFVADQIDYAKELEMIKYLPFEE